MSRRGPLELVISRFRENLRWILDPIVANYNVVVYDKCKDKPLDEDVRARIDLHIALPNTGRECGTYLHHIISRYNDLADVTAFVQGSASDPHKRSKLMFVLRTAENTASSVLAGRRHLDVASELGAFTLDSWESTHPANREVGTSHLLAKSDERPFGRWYHNRFGGFKSTLVCYYAIFAVARDHIRKRPKSFYERLYEADMRHHDGSECIHYMERAWDAVFMVPDTCKHYVQ